MYDFHNSTDTLKFWTEKQAINKTFFIFHPILMKLGEIVVHMDYYNFTKFQQNQMKNKKVLLIARFSVQNFKVSVESWKSYIVRYVCWEKMQKKSMFIPVLEDWIIPMIYQI